MANKRGKEIDNTYLSIDQATERGFPHADYIAHCLRWSHVVKFMRGNGVYQSARVVDVGCGKELPLAKTLYSSRLIVKHFLGLDYNKGSTIDMSPFHTGKFPIDAFGSVDFASNQVWFDKAADGRNCINVVGQAGGTDTKTEDYFIAPNVYVSFEVMEHVEPDHVRATFLKVKRGLELAAENGCPFTPRFFMSTPNWDVVHCADNHVNEMKHQALGWLIEDCGLSVVGRYGTFASQRDYKHKLFEDYPGAKAIYDKLHGYYESNYLATIFAPLYPQEARNCLWELTSRDLLANVHREFPDEVLDGLEPWTSSARWQDLHDGGGMYPYDPTNTPFGKMEAR